MLEEKNYCENECEQGTCTECQSDNIDFIGSHFNDLDYYIVEYKCLNCGAICKEKYKLDFIGIDTTPSL